MLSSKTIKLARQFLRRRDPDGLPYRPVAEAMLFDDQNRILAKEVDLGRGKSFIKFPGGGIDPGEDPETGLRRELLEEVGAQPHNLALSEKLDWDWWPAWAQTPKQKKRYMEFRGEGSHQFVGDLGQLSDPTSDEGDEWAERPMLDAHEILRRLRRERKTLQAGEKPYRNLQIRVLARALKQRLASG